MKKLLFGIGSLIVGGSIVTGYMVTKADAPTKEEVVQNFNEEQFIERVKNYPKNTFFTEDLQKQANQYTKSIERNEEPPIDRSLTSDNAEAIEYLVEGKKQDILRHMPFGELRLYETFEQGYYPQELLDEAVATYEPILNSVKAMSENETLDKIVDQTIVEMKEAAANGDAFGYLEAWNDINVIKETAGNRLYNEMF
ncbi:hypothetical protein JMM81_20820 [Bacillus sp. V3B]|uniref:hypothetical protein n=1 Tax=Bacillus sp. V3B TaxID=2804915 RepID=UPI00210B0F89|nr:hypothetical protein [Bacillus sp. V3B]MCQ6277320.1 hypothetical protein [Bacillus sp. V3B]